MCEESEVSTAGRKTLVGAPVGSNVKYSAVSFYTAVPILHIGDVEDAFCRLRSISIGGVTYNFAGGGVHLFRILGIELSAGLDPNNATAFITALTFAGDRTFSGTMTPLTAVATPLPATLPLFATGLGTFWEFDPPQSKTKRMTTA